LAANGYLAFSGGFVGPEVTQENNRAIWIGPPGALNRVPWRGYVPDGGDDFVFDEIGPPSIGSTGEGAFVATLKGPAAATRTAIFGLYSHGTYFAAQTDSFDDDFGLGVQFSLLSNEVPAVGDNSRIAFRATVFGIGITQANNTGIWRDFGGTLLSVARTGMSSGGPGLAGVRFAGLGTPTMNATGRVAFSATLTGTGINSTNDMGIWTAQTVRQIVARKGDAGPGPGLGLGTVFDYFENPTAITNSGDVCFRAKVSGLSVNTSNDDGIWVGAPNQMRLVMREGNPIPPTAGGAALSFGQPIFLDCNNGGHVAFTANLIGAGVNTSNEHSLWLADEDGLRLMAREGQQLPGLPPGVVLEHFRSVGLNDTGQIAVVATFRGPGFDDPQTRHGVWIVDASDQWHLIARSSQIIDADSAAGISLRTIARVEAYTKSSTGGTLSGFDSTGAMGMLIHFTDGSSGIFHSEPIPEPSATALVVMMVLGGVACSTARKKSRP
jgi:hypothetical protein